MVEPAAPAPAAPREFHCGSDHKANLTAFNVLYKFVGKDLGRYGFFHTAES